MINCDAGYLKDGNSAYIGSMMGRVANRIANGEFELNGEKHVLAKNFLGKHNLHGGVIGFDKFNWESHVEGNTVYLTHVSPDEYEGYPGTVVVTAKCKLTHDDSFSMNLSAVTSKPTIINMSNHSYFNLAGHHTGFKELYKHKLTMNANKILKISSEQIPTGEFQDVGDSCFDFRLPTELGDAISKTPGNGFDHNFCVTAGSSQSLTFVARVVHPSSGRTMEVYSDQPSVLFYTSNNLPDPCSNVSLSEFSIRSG
jgi:aldose 1-epimerase